MAIVHVRIDNRLIHGQVATMWTNQLKTTRIMVVDDAASKNDIKKTALKMATPSGVALSVLSVDKAAENIRNGKYDGQRVMMILGVVETLKRLLDRGVQIDTCNVGNLPAGEGRYYIAPTVAVSEGEARQLLEIDGSGVELTLQLIPSNPVNKLIPAMRKTFNDKGIDLR